MHLPLRLKHALIAVIFITSLTTTRTSAATASCEDLRNLKLPATAVTAAQLVAAGAFTTPSVRNPAAFKGVPAFCRVTAEIKRTADSDIKMEVWMPASGWNGRYHGVGNGGFAGSITYAGLADAVLHGFATASTDTGHSGFPTDASWALRHPVKIDDFGFVAIHEMTVKAKAIIKAFYGDAPKYSYFAGCSNGGRQALMEAQRYPEDYDGIIAGAPAYNFTHLLATAAWNAQATTNDLASYIPPAKIPVISAAVLAACDAQDGAKDGILNDPPACSFDPAVLLCKGAEGADTGNCLTAAQITALKKIYSGPRIASKNSMEQIYPGYLPGGEDGNGGWRLWITGDAPGKALLFAFDNGFFSSMVYDDPEWDYRKFDFAGGVKLADEKLARSLNATDANLKKFKTRGGKLIIWHGWSDPAIPPTGAVDYYNHVVREMGAADAPSFLRLYMAPGVQHCGGGPGPDSFGQFGLSSPQADPQHNMYAALEQWVEKGVAPETIIASKNPGPMGSAEPEKMTRPLCAWPQLAKYKGSGDLNDAASFVCEKSK